MNKKEFKLVSKLLEMASDIFGNHGSNNLPKDFYDGFTEQEQTEIAKLFQENNGSPCYYSEGDIINRDSSLMRYYADKLEALADDIPERFCFESDGDCGNFLIPLSKRERFNELLDLDDNFEAFNDEFSNYRIDGIEGCYSFEKVEVL